jgi:hypothetical protein
MRSRRLDRPARLITTRALVILVIAVLGGVIPGISLGTGVWLTLRELYPGPALWLGTTSGMGSTIFAALRIASLLDRLVEPDV